MKTIGFFGVHYFQTKPDDSRNFQVFPAKGGEIQPTDLKSIKPTYSTRGVLGKFGRMSAAGVFERVAIGHCAFCGTKQDYRGPKLSTLAAKENAKPRN